MPEVPIRSQGASRLLDPKVLARIGNVELLSRVVVEGVPERQTVHDREEDDGDGVGPVVATTEEREESQRPYARAPAGQDGCAAGAPSTS